MTHGVRLRARERARKHVTGKPLEPPGFFQQSLCRSTYHTKDAPKVIVPPISNGYHVEEEKEGGKRGGKKNNSDSGVIKYGVEARG